MIPNDLHYVFPHVAYVGLAVFLIVAVFWNLYRFRSNFLYHFSFGEEVITQRNRYSFWAKTFAACLVWIGATAVLMQPQGNGHYPKAISPDKKQEGITQRKVHDVIFLVDASASMKVPDARGGQTRFGYAKEIIDEVIRNLKGESVALYAFTSETTKLSPLTLDYLFVRLMVKQMHINEGDIAGTNIAEALAEIRDEYFATLTPKLKTLVLFTDGGDTQLEGLASEERKSAISSLGSFFDQSEGLNLNIVTVGLGTKEGGKIPDLVYEGKPVHSSLDAALLKSFSSDVRGKYYEANDYSATDLAQDVVNAIIDQPIQLEEYKVKRKIPVKGDEDLIYDLFFQIPLGFVLLLMAFILLYPDTIKKDGIFQ